MQPLTQKWAVIASFDPVEDYYLFDPSDTPLHLTFAGVFAVADNGRQLTEGLEKIASRHVPFQVTAGDEALFGAGEDIPVTLVRPSPDVLSLYGAVFSWLQERGVIYNSPDFQGDGYIPHVTWQRSGHLQPGETRWVRSLSLVDMFPGGDGLMRRIVKTVELAAVASD